MNEQQADYLKELYNYDSWRGVNRLEENLFVWQFFLRDDVFPGWRSHRIQEVDAPSWPPAIQSIWQRAEGGEGAFLNVDVYESASQEAAHESLVQLLGEFQSPDLTSQVETIVGDIAFFVLPGEAVILFARANLAALLRSAGRTLVSVTEMAASLDNEFISRPETDEDAAPDIVSFEAETEDEREEVVPLIVEAVDPQEQRLWYKLYSSTGTIRLAEGRLLYEATADGSQEITLYAINAAGAATAETLRFELGG